MRYSIYQMKTDPRGVRYMGYAFTRERGGVFANEYKKVYTGELGDKTLEDVYVRMNENVLPVTHQGRSMSVSDIVEVEGEGCWYCDSVGWEKTDFDTALADEMRGVRVLMLRPGEEPVETRVRDTLTDWQKAVSLRGEPSLIEVTFPFEGDIAVVGNEEAKLRSHPLNREINGEAYAGTLFIVGDDGEGNFRDLTDYEAEKYAREMSLENCGIGMMEHGPEDLSEDPGEEYAEAEEEQEFVKA